MINDLLDVSIINPLAHEISAKIVYYGPGLSGKTTSLKAIYSSVKPERRGELISLATEGDRTIFFDFLPIHVERVHDMSVRFQLYTVPGQVFYAATRKLVLNGADGVVFVADSHPSARQANLESFESLRNILSELGIDIEMFPLVLQYNKRDLEQTMPVAQMAADLNWLGAPEFETSANTGVGVLDALKGIMRQVIRALWARKSGALSRELSAPTTGSAATEGLLGRLKEVADEAPAPSVPAPAVIEVQQMQPSKVPPPPAHVSFAPLWVGRDEAVVTSVEQSISEGDYSQAARLAAVAIADILESLPGVRGEGFAGRVALIGLDGRDYLRLCRIAALPDAGINLADALFALHVLVSAHLKATSL